MAATDELMSRLQALEVSDADMARFERGDKQRKNFLKKFPIDSISNLSLDSYCVGRGDKDNFCWWIEFESVRGTDPIGGLGVVE